MDEKYKKPTDQHAAQSKNGPLFHGQYIVPSFTTIRRCVLIHSPFAPILPSDMSRPPPYNGASYNSHTLGNRLHGTSSSNAPPTGPRNVVSMPPSINKRPAPSRDSSPPTRKRIQADGSRPALGRVSERYEQPPNLPKNQHVWSTLGTATQHLGHIRVWGMTKVTVFHRGYVKAIGWMASNAHLWDDTNPHGDSFDGWVQHGSTKLPLDLTCSSSNAFITRSPISRPERGIGASTPAQSAPPAPSMIARDLVSTSTGTPPTQVCPPVSLESVNDMNEKLNYIKAQDGLRRIRQQGSDGPVSMARLHKLRSTKEAVYKANVAAYEEGLRLQGGKTASASSKATTINPASDAVSTKLSTQSAQVTALQILTKKLMDDNTTMANRLEQLENDRKSSEPKGNPHTSVETRQQVNVMVEKLVQDKLHELIQTCINDHCKPIVEHIVEKHRAKSSEATKTLSQDISSLQKFKEAVEHEKLSDLFKSLPQQLTAINKKTSQLCLDVNQDGGKLSKVQQKMETLTRETAAEKSWINEQITKAVEPINKRLERFDTSLKEKLDTTSKASRESETKLRKDITWLDKRVAKLQEDQVLAVQAQTEKMVADELEKSNRDQAEKTSRDNLIKSIQALYDKRIGGLETRLIKIKETQETSVRDGLQRQLQPLDARVNKLEATCNNLATAEDLSQKTSALDARISTVEITEKTGRSTISQDMSALDKRLTTLENTEDQTIRGDLSKLTDRVKILENESDPQVRGHLVDELQEVQTQVSGLRKDFDAGFSNIRDVGKRYTDVETAKLRLQIPTDGTSSTTSQSSQDLVDKILHLESSTAELRDSLEETSGDLTDVEKAVHDHNRAIQVLKEGLPTIFLETLRPFQEATEKDLKNINEKLSAQCSFIEHLSSSVDKVKIKQSLIPAQSNAASHSNSRTNTPQPSSTDVEIRFKQLSAEIVQLDAAIKAIPSEREAVQELRDKLDITVRACQSLERRYENINTAELHQQMVNQFQQMYPQAPGMFQKMSEIEAATRNTDRRVQALQTDMDIERNERIQRDKHIDNTIMSGVAGIKKVSDEFDKDVRKRVEQFGNLTKHIDQIVEDYIKLEDRVRQTEELATHVIRVEAENQKITDTIGFAAKLHEMLEKRVKRVEGLDKRTHDLEADMDKAGKRSVAIEQKAEALDERVTKIDTDVGNLEGRVKKMEPTASDITQRMASIDHLIRMKRDLKQVTIAVPHLATSIYKIAGYVETINMNADRPIAGLNLQSARMDPFKTHDGDEDDDED
ncbi:hypothetical protein K504DRAFT_500776 [Pleomassaria siparia CBS 279.74]|uniref:Uncharacterized protein n=1 Tax=Pleomassaria siparia CBS 279.74 TaxID=1314801 RepID=A0A6G1KDY0_9PLEO|nr:hypothetical protein K504DRAFT_500776 [Pleomassaria siparia CBS 279.74]